MATTPALFQHQTSTDLQRASLTIDVHRRADAPLHPHLLGKFCEHLGTNIYQGMDAQILFNSTFARWRFAAGTHPDGGVCEASEREVIRANAEHVDYWPEPDRLIDAYFAGGAWGWFRIGSASEVRLSPDVAAAGGRAQRLEIALQTVRGKPAFAILPGHIDFQ